MRKQLDKNLSFHKLVAYMIALMTGEHFLFSLNFRSKRIVSHFNRDKEIKDSFFNQHLFWIVCVHASSTPATGVDLGSRGFENVLPVKVFFRQQSNKIHKTTLFTLRLKFAVGNASCGTIVFHSLLYSTLFKLFWLEDFQYLS